jgi:hypothetical protein
MARYDRLIAFLEDEAQALRARIADLEDDDDLQAGVTTGEGGEPPSHRERRQAERKLGEIEGHLRELRADQRV